MHNICMCNLYISVYVCLNINMFLLVRMYMYIHKYVCMIACLQTFYFV